MLDKAPSESVRMSANLIVILLMAANLLLLIKDPRSPYWLIYYILLGIIFYMINLSIWCPQYYASNRVNQHYHLKKLNKLVSDRDPPPSYSSLRPGSGVAKSVKGKSPSISKCRGKAKKSSKANANHRRPAGTYTVLKESSKIMVNPCMKYGTTEISEIHVAAVKPSVAVSPQMLPNATQASQSIPNATTPGVSGRPAVYGAEARPITMDSHEKLHGMSVVNLSFEEDDLPSYQKATAASNNNDKLDPFHV